MAVSFDQTLKGGREMDNYGYHLISLKFLTAIILALIFAFLFIYVFSPLQKEEYPVYSFEQEKIADLETESVFSTSEKNHFFQNSAQIENFQSQLKNRSFAVMEQSKNAVSTVITSNHLGEINSLKEREDLLLKNFKRDLARREEELLQQKRQELEADLASKLQNLRRQIREKYSDYSQQQIGKNYLKIINLRIAVEVLAYNEAEKERYQKELNQVKEQQEELLAEKNSALNEEISAETSTLIMEFNQNYAEYRKQLRSKQQKLLAEKEKELKLKLAQHRDEIKKELNLKRKEADSVMDQLIAESKEYY